MTNRYKMVVFDFDGTLADSLPFMASMLDQLADRHGLRRMDQSEIPLLREYKVRKLMRMHHVPFWKLPALARDMQDMMHKNIGSIKLFPGMDRVIKDLYACNTKIAVVTSNALRNVHAVLGSEIVKCVSNFECGVPLLKKSGVLRKIINESSVLRHEILCIGDEIRDIEAARRIGVPCVAVNWGFASQSALERSRPDFLVNSAEQILELAGVSV